MQQKMWGYTTSLYKLSLLLLKVRKDNKLYCDMVYYVFIFLQSINSCKASQHGPVVKMLLSLLTILKKRYTLQMRIYKYLDTSTEIQTFQ